MTFRQTIERDLIANKVISENQSCTFLLLLKHVVHGLLLYPNFACVFWYRINRWMYLHHVPGKIVEGVNASRYYRFANDINYRADIGPGFRVVHVVGIVIGGGVKIGANCTVYNDVSIGRKSKVDTAMPILGDDAIIGAGSKILGGVSIADHVTIGAMTFLDKSVPSNSVVYGIPPNQTIKQKNV